jgi:hypothetical protein
MQELPSAVRRIHFLRSARLMSGADFSGASRRELAVALHMPSPDCNGATRVRFIRETNIPSHPVLTSPSLPKSQALPDARDGDQHSRLICGETKRRKPNADNRSLG